MVEKSVDWKPLPLLNKKDPIRVAQLDYLHRAINLDDFILGNNYVLTGVRFHWVGEHIGLMVQVGTLRPGLRFDK